MSSPAKNSSALKRMVQPMPRPMPRHPAASKPPTVSLISLGCPRTLVDSELYLGRLKQAGFRLVDEVEGSDAVVINTCSFVQDAVKESLEVILQAVELKRQGRLKAVVVAGCLVQRFKDELTGELSEVDGFVGIDAFDSIDVVVKEALAGARPQEIRRLPQPFRHGGHLDRHPLTPSHYAYLKVSEGCRKGCSFCIIPRIKGPLRSRPMDDLVVEARQLVEERGVKELVVIGQDTSDYGKDIYGRAEIATLMGRLTKIQGLKWIRLLYHHPTGVTQELIDVIRDSPTICKYLDLPIEHADDEILRRMNRNITRAQLREVIARLRSEIPELALRTSVIVGFPGESTEAFEALVSFLKEIKFERLGAFRYSREKDSASFRFSNQIPDDVSLRRLDRLMQVQRTIAEDVNRRFIGRTCEVVIDEADASDPTQFVGRTSIDCPEVDGNVFVHSTSPLAPGSWIPVALNDSYEYDLVGEAVPRHTSVSDVA